MEQGSSSLSTITSPSNRDQILQPKPKVFLSHSGAQKGFVEQLRVDLERCDRHSFFDKDRKCLPIGTPFPRLIFEAIEHCEVGVVVLSEDFFTSKWPMLELVAMTNVQKRKPSFTIMPILLGMTLSRCQDPKNHEEWSSLWQPWAKRDDRLDVQELESALRLLGRTNALKYNLELGEVKFREEIVEAICALVPPTTRFEDSHIQGRSRLCKVIHETIEASKVSSIHGVRVVGLYGVGGIGKTTICKAMCNHLLEEYRNKVGYVELKSQSKVEELLKEVLGNLTDKSPERLGTMDVDKYRHHLERDMVDAKVFLAIDNVSSETTNQALTLLRAKYGVGSVVLVTARSLNELMALRLDASACIEMPELEMEEARSLFLYHALCVPSTYLSNQDDFELISYCVERCHFQKGDGKSGHYHPLALRVLGEQLGCVGYVHKRWWSHLKKLDFLNPYGEVHHPVFSILRRSFDALNPQDQLLFMDVALFAPYNNFFHWWCSHKWNIFEWLGMVHGIAMEDVIERLENLKKKSVLESLGNGFGRIGMHDLWREFARLETKVGEFDKRRWMYEDNGIEEGNLTNGGCWVKVRRMFFLDHGFMKVMDVKFSCFPNIEILKLQTCMDFHVSLDLSGLKQLKILELNYWLFKPKTSISLVGLGFLKKLVSLQWLDIPSNSTCIDDISRLTKLKVLVLYRCGRLPNLKNLVSLQVVYFCQNDSVVNFIGLSSKHTNLQFLNLSNCLSLESCPSVGELVSLQELCLSSCSKLKELPNLRKLKRLRKLDVDSCRLLTCLPSLGGLVNLENLIIVGCSNLLELPGLCNLQKLRILDMGSCKSIKSLPGLEELVSLQSLQMLDCKNLIDLPSIVQLTNLQTLELDFNCTPQASKGWFGLNYLQSFDVGVDKFYNGLNLFKLTKLQTLHIYGWLGEGFSSLAELVLLESITISNCKGVRVLPNLERLSRLRSLTLKKCSFEDLFGLMNVTSLENLVVFDCDKLDALPNLRELARLRILRVQYGAQLRDVHGILGLRNLKWLEVIGHPWLFENLGLDLQVFSSLRSLDVSNGGFEDLQGLIACSQLRNLTCRRCPIQEFPDLTNFPELVSLNFKDCVNLTKLMCTGPLSSKLQSLDVSKCMRLQVLPDLTNVQNMHFLDVSNSGVVISAQLIEDMKKRWPSIKLITQDTSFWMQLQRHFCRIWHHSL